MRVISKFAMKFMTTRKNTIIHGVRMWVRHGMQVCTYVGMYVGMNVYMYECVYMKMCVGMHIGTYVNTSL